MFPTTAHTRQQPGNPGKIIRRILDRAGYPTASNHTIRRTVGMRLLHAGVPRLEAEQIMGHTETMAWSAYMDRQTLPLAGLKGLERRSDDAE